MAMRGMMADHDSEGHLTILTGHLEKEPWHEFWVSLNLVRLTFADLGLTPDAPDAQLWQVCQHEQIVLVTRNRNADDPDSLETTIRTQNTLASLPVFTLTNADRVLQDGAYAERAARRLLEYLLEIDKVRGTGRLYLP
jgi:hypothetical protein